ncbi:MAG: hypothetical protein KAJ42_17810 [Gemmatimonadetes bacterium]|nr:hypothetical protein [Gemmatimonadota bacterium]
MRDRVWHTGVAVLPFLLLWACASGSEPPSTTTVRDSAGVTIVENSHAPETDDGGWWVDPEPMLSIGTVSGDPEYQMFTVNGAQRLSDGRIAIANDGSQDVRIYGADGVYQRSLGGHGSGPGEFNSLWYLGRYGGDTLVVLDGYLRRISYLHPDHGFIRSFNTEQELGLILIAQGNLTDGRLVFGGGPIWGGPVQPEEGFSRDRTRFLVAGLDGSLEQSLGEFPGAEIYIRSSEDGIEVVMVPFSKAPAGAAWGNLIYVGISDSYQILVYDAGGDLVRIIRLEQDPLPVTPEDTETYIQERVARVVDAEQRRRMEEVYRAPPPLDRMPAYRRFMTDGLGCLWVEESRRPGNDVPVWTVFNPEGAVLGRVSLPAGLYVQEIGEDYVLGVYTDDLDVEYVHMYRLERPTT